MLPSGNERGASGAVMAVLLVVLALAIGLFAFIDNAFSNESISGVQAAVHDCDNPNTFIGPPDPTTCTDAKAKLAEFRSNPFPLYFQEAGPAAVTTFLVLLIVAVLLGGFAWRLLSGPGAVVAGAVVSRQAGDSADHDGDAALKSDLDAIANAKHLLDSGALTESEFESVKSRILNQSSRPRGRSS